MTRGGPRPNAGRKAPGGIKKNHSIKFTDAEWADLKEKAQAVGKNVSDYVRSCLYEPKEGK